MSFQSTTTSISYVKLFTSLICVFINFVHNGPKNNPKGVRMALPPANRGPLFLISVWQPAHPEASNKYLPSMILEVCFEPA